MVYIKKIWNTFLSCCLVFSLLFVDTYSKSDDAVKGNKAIIFVPRVLTSGLFYNGEPNLKYYKNESLWIGLSSSKIQTLKAVSKFLLYYKDLFCDENGIPVNKNVGLSRHTKYVYESDSKTVKFGILSLCEKLLNGLDKNFGVKNGGEYKIVLHNYDWRVDCGENSKLLTEEIMKYDEVILVGYSMGGLISCKSAAELQEKNELHRIKAYISVAVPYNGSTDALYLLEEGFLTGNSIVDKVSEIIGIPEIMRELSCNCVPTYELLPTRKFFKKSEDGFVCSEKNNFSNYDESMELLKSRIWAKKFNGSNKNLFEKAENFHKSLYVNGEHIVNLMDSYFIVGSGMKTKGKVLIDRNFKNHAEIVSYVDGDGTVALNESAVPPGKTLDDVTRVYCQHSEILNDELTIKYIVNTISKKVFSELKKHSA